MFCPLCESENPAASKRCRACGASLGAREASGPNEAPDALAVGSVLGRLYLVEGILGQGGFGITYRCRDQMLERPVAVKEFFPMGSRRAGVAVEPGRTSSDQFREARAQFLSEAKLLARCHHPGVVMVHTAFEENGTAYMVMELLHGQNLMQLMDARAGATPEADALAPIERVGQALEYVHSQGLLHRDIKPENIIACDDGRVMLIDFGTAREYAQGQSQGHTVAVTPGFAPLEQYAKQAKRGAFTDVYGLAATLYYLLTGAPPPAASDRAMGVVVRPLREQNPRVSAPVAHAVEAGLQMEIARRPQSVRAFLELLHAPASEAPTLLPPTPFPPALSQAETEANLQAQIAGFVSLLPAPNPTIPLAPTPFAPVALAPLAPAPDKPSLPRPSSASLPSPFTSSSLAPTTPYLPPSTPLNQGGGIGVNDTTPSNILRWVVGVPILITSMLMALQCATSPPTPPSSITWTSPGNPPNFSPPNYSSPPTNYSPNFSTPAPAGITEPLPGIAPLSVQKLPVSLGAKLGDSAPFFPNWATFSPDGKWVAYCDAANVVRVWSQSARRVVRTLPQPKEHPIREMSFAPSGKLLATFYRGEPDYGCNRVSVWNVQSGKVLGTLDVGSEGERFDIGAVRSDGQVLLYHGTSWSNSATRPTSWFWWNPRTGSKTPSALGRRVVDNEVAFSPQTGKLVTGDRAGHISWFDARTGALTAQNKALLTVRQFRASSAYRQVLESSLEGKQLDAPLMVDTLKFSSNGSFVASRNLGEICVFDHNGQSVGTITAPFSSTFAVSPDGLLVVDSPFSYASEQGIQLLALGQGQGARLLVRKPMKGYGGAVTFSPDGKRAQAVVQTAEGIALYTWPVKEHKPSVPRVAGVSAPFSFAPYALTGTRGFSSSPGAAHAVSDKFVASVSNGAAYINDVGGSSIKTMGVNVGGAVQQGDLAASPDGGLLGVRGPTGQTQVLKVDGGAPLSFRASPPSPANGNPQGQNKSLVFSPDHRLVALVGANSGSEVVELWALQGVPRRLASISHTAPATALAFSPNGRALLIGYKGGAVQWFDVWTRRVAAETAIDSASTAVAAIATSGKGWLVAKKNGGTLSVVRYGGADTADSATASAALSSPNVLFSVEATTDIAAFSPDGNVLAAPFVGANSQSINFWNAAAGSFLQKLLVSQLPDDNPLRFQSLSFSPDGKRLSCLRFNPQNSVAEVGTWQQPAAPRSGS